MTFTIRASRKTDSERATRPSPNRALVVEHRSHCAVIALGFARFVLVNGEADRPPATVSRSVEIVASLEAKVAVRSDQSFRLAGAGRGLPPGRHRIRQPVLLHASCGGLG